MWEKGRRDHLICYLKIIDHASLFGLYFNIPEAHQGMPINRLFARSLNFLSCTSLHHDHYIMITWGTKTVKTWSWEVLTNPDFLPGYKILTEPPYSGHSLSLMEGITYFSLNNCFLDFGWRLIGWSVMIKIRPN